MVFDEEVERYEDMTVGYSGPMEEQYQQVYRRDEGYWKTRIHCVDGAFWCLLVT